MYPTGDRRAAGSGNKKRLAKSGSRSQDAVGRTYPDQADFAERGDGCGFNNMADIIHDFLHYNRTMQANLAERMENILPADEWELLQRVAETAGRLGLPLYAVGGLPRDLLLGSPGKDLDVVVEGPAEDLARALAGRYGGRVVVHGRFGTAKWETPVPAGQPTGGAQQNGARRVLDLVTARSEVYRQPGALPSVTAGGIADDLRRRDFTINAIAIRLDGSHLGELRDDMGGRRDLEQGIVRVLHERSFIDDPTRMYRAVRYESRYGFRMADETLALLPGGREGVRKLSAQRIRHELDLILDEERAQAILRRLAELDLLRAIHASLSFGAGAARRLAAAEQAPLLAIPALPRRGLRWLLWLMELPAPEIASLQERLHFTSALFKDLAGASRLLSQVDSLVGLPPSGWDEHLQEAPPAAVYAVCLTLDPGPARAALKSYLREWRHLRPRTTGHDLKDLGLEPGAQYRQILRELRRAWLDGEIRSEEDEQTYLRALLNR